MCWNASVSLNTFIFSVATLAFIAYNNAYTKYKVVEFLQVPHRPKTGGSYWLYAFILSVSGMQLVEYFLWSFPTMNRTMSIVGSLLLLLQPFTLSMSANLPYLAGMYGTFALLFILAKYPGNLNRFSTEKSPTSGLVKDRPMGLVWHWFDEYEYNWLYYLAYWGTAIACAFYLPAYLSVAIFGVAALTMLRWRNGKTMMWASKYCWGLNVLAFYYLFRIMIAMPFNQN